MVRAIKAISQKPVETKAFPYSDNFSSFLTNSGYVSGSSHIIRQNIYSEIPRLKNSATVTEQSFIGNDIQSRGLRWEIHAYAGSAGATPDCAFRFTVLHIPGYAAGTSGILPSGPDFDQDYTNVPTWSRWNMQTVKVIFQRRFRMGESSTDPGHLMRKFYVPLRRKVTAIGEESIVLNTLMAQIKGEQYYWVLEMFAPTIADLRANILGAIDTTVYFKDA